MKKYWLMKSEPDVFSIDHLKQEKLSSWEGVRNYQARNYMTNEMNPGDEVLFYHSSCDPAGVAGRALVATKAAPDQLQFDKKSEYHDPKSTKEKPIWFCVKVKFKEKFKQIYTLAQIKSDPDLKGIMVAQKGSRLSIQPVSEKHFRLILSRAGAKK